MSRLDYSKWDKFDYASSDEEDDNRPYPQPTVTRLNDGDRIHIGPSGSSIDSSNAPPAPSLSPSHTGNESSKKVGATSSSEPPATAAAVPSSLPVNKAQDTIYRSSHTPEGGGFPITYKWKQTRQEVFLWVSIAHSLKASAIQVEYKATSNTLRISTNGIELIAGELNYKIIHEEDSPLDWEITTAPTATSIPSEASTSTPAQKVIQIIFQKHVYTPGSVVWWSSIFSGDDPIDVTQIPERLRTQKTVRVSDPTATGVSATDVDSDVSAAATTHVSSSQSFADAWKEAHSLFTEKVKEKEQIEIYDDDEGEEEDEL